MNLGFFGFFHLSILLGFGGYSTTGGGHRKSSVRHHIYVSSISTGAELTTLIEDTFEKAAPVTLKENETPDSYREPGV